MLDLDTNPLGENLGPCPCCHVQKRRTYTESTKGLAKAFREGHSFFLKVGEETLYVDRAGYASAIGEGSTVYNEPRGYAKNLVTPGTVPFKLRDKKGKTIKTKTEKVPKLKLTKVKIKKTRAKKVKEPKS